MAKDKIIPEETEANNNEPTTISIKGIIITFLLFNLVFTNTIEAVKYRDMTQTQLFFHLPKSFIKLPDK